MVLVVAGALNLDGLAVEEEALFRIEDRSAHAEADALGIARLAGGFNGDDCGVEIGRFDRPEGGIGELAVAVERGAVDGTTVRRLRR